MQTHPAVVTLAITAGASVAGVLGMLLAVPSTAAVLPYAVEGAGR